MAFSLVGAKEAAEYCGLSEESLRAWTESGHAPHYKLDGSEPMYKKTELKQWVADNLITAHSGMSVPRKLQVLMAVNAVQTGAPPLAISTIENLLYVPITATCSGIYFLCKGNDVVYVGQAISVLARIACHIGEGVKEFDHDRIFFLPCPRGQLNQVEKHWIVTLRPKYNKTHGARRPENLAPCATEREEDSQALEWDTDMIMRVKSGECAGMVGLVDNEEDGMGFIYLGRWADGYTMIPVKDLEKAAEEEAQQYIDDYMSQPEYYSGLI